MTRWRPRPLYFANIYDKTCFYFLLHDCQHWTYTMIPLNYPKLLLRLCYNFWSTVFCSFSIPIRVNFISQTIRLWGFLYKILFFSSEHSETVNLFQFTKLDLTLPIHSEFNAIVTFCHSLVNGRNQKQTALWIFLFYCIYRGI